MAEEKIDRAYMDLRIREVMQRKGVTGIELAERMGKHSQYIYNIINGGPQASIGALIAVAKALGVPFRDLFGPGEGREREGHCPYCGHELHIIIQ